MARPFGSLLPVPIFPILLVLGCERTPAALYPDHPMGLAATALADTAFTWRTHTTKHFRVHVQPGSFAEGRQERFVADAEQARVIGLDILGEKRFVPRIDVFHLTSREQVKRLTGFPVLGVGRS